jgi:hypothetical protein
MSKFGNGNGNAEKTKDQLYFFDLRKFRIPKSISVIRLFIKFLSF